MRIYTLALSGLLLAGGTVNSALFNRISSQPEPSPASAYLLVEQPNCDDHRGGNDRCQYRGSGRKEANAIIQDLVASSHPGTDDREQAQRGSGRKESASVLQNLLADTTPGTENGEQSQRGSGRKDHASTWEQFLADSTPGTQPDGGDEAQRGSGRREA